MAGRSAASVVRGYPVSEQYTSDGRPGGDGLVVEAAVGEVSGREALDQHVGVSTSSRRRSRSAGESRSSTTLRLPRLVTTDPTYDALRVAPGGLDLHHVGTVVAEHHGRERSRESGGQIDDPETFERAGHRASWRSAVG